MLRFTLLRSALLRTLRRVTLVLHQITLLRVALSRVASLGLVLFLNASGRFALLSFAFLRTTLLRISPRTSALFFLVWP